MSGFMSRYKPILTSVLILPTSVLILLSSCLGQEKDRGGTSPTVALPILMHALSTARVSGSIAYWGRCEAFKPYPDFPTLRYSWNDAQSTVELLRDVFAPDPKMEVTQEPNGLIRMFETDVPMDLLNIKIRHVSFGFPDQDSGVFNGPNDALYVILSSPEVRTYRAAHRIGPFTDRVSGSGSPSSTRQVSGDLYDVTVKQALDYVLQTFPGFWIYQNCPTREGEPGRDVHFGFYKTHMPGTGNSSTATPQ